MHHRQILSVCLLHTFLQQTVTWSVAVNRNRVQNGTMPYMATVRNFMYPICEGFLVSDHFVLTAAHCSDKKPKTVVLKDEQGIDIKALIKHDNFQNKNLGNDLMLIELKNKASLEKGVQIIQLPNMDMEVKADDKCQVAGRESLINVSIINKTTCQMNKNTWKNLPHNVICAKGDAGLSEEDSGGPLVCHNTAVGLLSLTKAQELVFVDISKYIDWIKKKMY